MKSVGTIRPNRTVGRLALAIRRRKSRNPDELLTVKAGPCATQPCRFSGTQRVSAKIKMGEIVSLRSDKVPSLALRSRIVREIYELKGKGRSINGIADDLGISRNTVRKYVR